jgi:hypothetical protein
VFIARAFVFNRHAGGADKWGQLAKLTAADFAMEDAFGWAVSVSGSIVAVGSPYNTAAGAGSESGSAYVFDLARTP